MKIDLMSRSYDQHLSHKAHTSSPTYLGRWKALTNFNHFFLLSAWYTIFETECHLSCDFITIIFQDLAFFDDWNKLIAVSHLPLKPSPYLCAGQDW